MYTFAAWYKTPWDKINVDVLIEETKKMAKDVKTLNKAVSKASSAVASGRNHSLRHGGSFAR